MHLNSTLLALTLLLTPLSLSAQSTQELAEEYVNMPEVQMMIDDMFSAQSMGTQFAANLPPNIAVSEAQMTEIGALLAEAMSGIRPRMEELMISGSAETFSTDELQALIEFYQSEHGAAIMTKMQPFMVTVMTALAPEMMQVQQAVTPQLLAILQGK